LTEPGVRILALCGSLSARSANLSLLETAQRVAPPGVDVVIYDGIRNLPLFNPDLEVSGPPATVEDFRRQLGSSDAVLIASPEYGHSLPGSLKNAIDWAIGSGELERKVVAITAAVRAANAGRRGLKALRDTLGAVSARVVGGEPTVQGPSFDADVAALIQGLIREHATPEA
jgi:NAD(P)H-dependent FMN reductase